MQYNILRNSDVTNIFLTYIEKGVKRKYPVKLRFIDDKECYFATELYTNFVKPKRKIPVTITAYTPEGVYTTDVTLNDTVVSSGNIIYQVNLPKTWSYKQMRQSSRKLHGLPFEIKFNDGFKITGTTHDISVGGISFISKEKFSSIYKKLPAKLYMKLSPDVIIATEYSNIEVNTKFVREQVNIDEFETDKVLYVWKFLGMTMDQLEFLKSYIICLD